MNYRECDIWRIVKVFRELGEKEAPVQIEKISAQGLILFGGAADRRHGA